MNKKLLDDANAAGFDVAYGQVTLNGRASDTVLNYKLAKFAALQQQNSEIGRAHV